MLKTASSPPPPSTSQVSLPSEIGATDIIMRSRQFSFFADANRMPTPRSKPSTITSIATAKAMNQAQTSGSQKARPWYSVPKPNIALPRRLHAAAGPAAEALVRHRERALRLLVGAVPELGPAHRLLQRLGPFAEELREVVAAEAEDEGIDDDEGRERARDRTARDGRHGVGRAQQAVDHERLAADLGREPAEQHRPEARRRHEHGGAQEPAALAELAAPAQPQAPQREAEHRESDPDHDAEREEHRPDRRAAVRRHVLQARHDPLSFMGQDIAAEPRDRDLVTVLFRLLIRPGEEHERRRGAPLPIRLDGR